MSSFGRIFLVIKIWDVIVGITPVAFGSKICNAQMIEARKENQDPNNQDRDSSVCFLEKKRTRPSLHRHVFLNLPTLGR